MRPSFGGGQTCPLSLDIPDSGDDWKSYSRRIEKYVEEHGIDIDADPLVQLLSAERGVFEALASVVVHGLSDVFTPQGLPPPGLALLQKLKVNSGFTLQEGGDPVSVPNLVRHMYSNGYDLRHFATMAIVPGFAELAIRTYHYVRTAGQDEELGRNRIRGRLTLSQMLALTHGLLASGNIVKMALYGWNPTALSYAQFLALGKQMISLVKLSTERNALIQQELAKGWEALLAEGEGSARSTRIRATTG